MSPMQPKMIDNQAQTQSNYLQDISLASINEHNYVTLLTKQQNASVDESLRQNASSYDARKATDISFKSFNML